MRGTCASVSGIAAKAPETSVHQHSLCPELLALKPAQTRDLHADAAIHKHMSDKGHKQAPQEIFLLLCYWARASIQEIVKTRLNNSFAERPMSGCAMRTSFLPVSSPVPRSGSSVKPSAKPVAGPG